MVKKYMSTVSTKYQIVIPKGIREQIALTPQDKFDFSVTKDGDLLLKKKKKVSILDFKGIFKYPKNYLIKERASWEKKIG